jgi:hypothetical protein
MDDTQQHDENPYDRNKNPKKPLELRKFFQCKCENKSKQDDMHKKFTDYCYEDEVEDICRKRFYYLLAGHIEGEMKALNLPPETTTASELIKVLREQH